MLNNEFKIVALFHMTGTLKGKVTWVTEKEKEKKQKKLI